MGTEAFLQIIKDPILLDWATSNIIEDKKDQQKLIQDLFEAAKPWLNTELFVEENKHKEAEEEKRATITKGANKQDVVTENAIDAFLRRRGLKKEEING